MTAPRLTVPLAAFEAAEQAATECVGRQPDGLPRHNRDSLGDCCVRAAVEAAAPHIVTQALDAAHVRALYDFWRFHHHEAGGYDASTIGLVTAYDRDDAFEFDRLSDLVEPHESTIRAVLGLAADTPAARLASLHAQPHTPTPNCPDTCHCQEKP